MDSGFSIPCRDFQTVANHGSMDRFGFQALGQFLLPFEQPARPAQWRLSVHWPVASGSFCDGDRPPPQRKAPQIHSSNYPFQDHNSRDSGCSRQICGTARPLAQATTHSRRRKGLDQRFACFSREGSRMLSVPDFLLYLRRSLHCE